MQKIILICTALVVFMSGCAQTTKKRPVSAGEALLGIGAAVLDMFSESEIDSWRSQNVENLNRRRQWQADNPS